MKKENLLGRKFTRLLVIAEAEHHSGRPAWSCQCDCGNIKIVKSEELKNGDTKSCGCLNQDKRRERAHNLYKSCIKYHPTITSARRVWKKRYNEGDLSFDDFYRLSQMNCFYCDSPPNNKQNAASECGEASQYAKDNGDFFYNGLDRIDSSIRYYTLSNVIPCCKWCNYSKRERTVKQFEEWIEKVYVSLMKRKLTIKEIEDNIQLAFKW